MLLDAYSGPARILQPGGIEVAVHCDYRVEQQHVAGVHGLVSWAGRYSDPEPPNRLDRNLGAELVLPDGRRGSILITNIFGAFSSYDAAERGEFTGSGAHPAH